MEEEQKERKNSRPISIQCKMCKIVHADTCTRGEHTHARAGRGCKIDAETNRRFASENQARLHWEMVFWTRGGQRVDRQSELDGTEVNHAPCVNSLPKPLVLLLTGADLRSAPEIPI